MNDSDRPKRGDAQQIRFDWDRIKQRLARLQESVAQSHKLSPEQAQVVMDMRAQTLARVPTQAVDARETREFVTFVLADERLAIETRFVCEVVRPGEIVPLPDAPDFLRGVTNLRGEVLAIVDLRTILGLAKAPIRGPSEVLILGADRPEFGILAEHVREVVALEVNQLLEPPESVGKGDCDCLAGVTEDAMLVLDGDVLLEDSRLVIDQSD